jgi:cell division protein FtsI (penicillin-binding protein 3)
MLREVVSGGTSTKADLATLDVSGKSGTALRTNKGHYQAGAYTASFVGLFPEDRPQFAILVKLDNPQNGYYGGVVAGAVTNVVLRAALSARDASLNLQQLATSVHAPRPDTSLAARVAAKAKSRADSVRLAALPAPRPAAIAADTDPRTSASYVIKLPSALRIAPVTNAVRAVPDVSGLSLRAAARTLHAAGFRVELISGQAPQTIPAAGTLWMPGRVVKLSAEQ